MMPPYMNVKVRYTPGSTCPTLYEECVGSLTSLRFIVKGLLDGAYGLLSLSDS